MDSKTKLGLFAVCYTIGTTAAFALYFVLGESQEVDWRSIAELAPQFLPTLLFGYFANGFKEVLYLTLTACIINAIFTVVTWYAIPEIYEPSLSVFGSSIALFSILVFITIFIFSFTIFSLGYVSAKVVTKFRQ